MPSCEWLQFQNKPLSFGIKISLKMDNLVENPTSKWTLALLLHIKQGGDEVGHWPNRNPTQCRCSSMHQGDIYAVSKTKNQNGSWQKWRNRRFRTIIFRTLIFRTMICRIKTFAQPVLTPKGTVWHVICTLTIRQFSIAESQPPRYHWLSHVQGWNGLVCWEATRDQELIRSPKVKAETRNHSKSGAIDGSVESMNVRKYRRNWGENGRSYWVRDSTMAGTIRNDKHGATKGSEQITRRLFSAFS